MECLKANFKLYAESTTKDISDLQAEREQADAQINDLTAEVLRLVKERDKYRLDWLQINSDVKAIRDWVGFEEVCI